jgi:hypothetical protein
MDRHWLSTPHTKRLIYRALELTDDLQVNKAADEMTFIRRNRHALWATGHRAGCWAAAGRHGDSICIAAICGVRQQVRVFATVRGLTTNRGGIWTTWPESRAE